jgi:peroxiredoxin
MQRDTVAQAILGALLLTSTFLNVLQARHIKEINDNTLAGNPPIPLGSSMPPLDVKDLSGREFRLDYGESRLPTVVYVFSPSCGWCERNSTNVRALVSQAKSKYRFIGLSLTSHGLGNYLEAHDVDFPTYSDPSDASRSQYHLYSTPTTFVIARSGKLLKIWAGAYLGQTRSDIEHFFSVQLPEPSKPGPPIPRTKRTN